MRLVPAMEQYLGLSWLRQCVNDGDPQVAKRPMALQFSRIQGGQIALRDAPVSDLRYCCFKQI